MLKSLPAVLLFFALHANGFAAEKGTLVAVNQNDADVSLIDLATGRPMAIIAEDGRIKAHEVAVSPDGKTLYLPIYGSAGVGHAGTDGSEMLVIDVPTRRIVHVVDFGHGVRPHKPVYDQHRDVLYVSAELDQVLLAIDPHTFKTMYTIPTGQPQSHMFVLSHDGRFAYTANVSAGSVSVLDLDKHTLTAVIPVATSLQRIAISNDDKTVFVSDATSPRLAAIDTGTHAVRAWMDLPAKGYGAVPTNDGKDLLIALPSSKQVAVIDVASMTLIKSMDVPANPQELLLSLDGSTAWVSCSVSKQIAEIDVKSLAVRTLLPAGMWVDGLAWTAVH